MTLIWREDTAPDVYTVAELTNYLELCEQGLKIDLCVPAPRPFPSSVLAIETDHKPADYFLAGLVFVVSGELRSVLETFNVHAEFHELSVTHKSKQYTSKEYYYCNILDAVDCLDYELSEYKTTPHGVTRIEKLVIDESKSMSSN